VDLGLYLRVLWRFRVLVGAGLLAAILLAGMAVVRPSFSHGFKLSYRQDQQWVSNSTLFVTQEGFPWGYAAPPAVSNAQAVTEAKRLTPQFADAGRFPTLAVLYSYLAQSDAVKAIVRRSGKIDGKIIAAPVVAMENGYGTTLPLVTISGVSTTPPKARALTIRATEAFRVFLEQQQTRNQIPAQNRVLVTIVEQARKPELLKGRSKTLPLVVFVTVIMSVVGLALLLENMRPRVRPVRDDVARLPRSEQQTA
jgi:hypothetical protein